MQRIVSGSKVQNTTDLQKGAVVESMVDRAAQLYSEEPVTWTGTQITFTQPIQLQFQREAGGALADNRILIAASPISLADGEALIARIDRSSGTTNLAVGTYPGLAAGEFAVVALASLSAIDILRKDHVMLFRRIDTSGGLAQLMLPLHKQILDPGQTVFLGASGAESGGEGGISVAPGYQWLEIDDFSELPASSDSKINSTFTNATHNIAKKLFQLSCDKSLTCTTTGTTFTLSGDPGFTLAIGDIIYDDTSTEWRRVASISGTGPTAGTIDAAFTSDLSADTVMVSQALWTLDLVGFGSVSEKKRAGDQHIGEENSEILVDYQDSLASGDDCADFVDTARVVMSASNEGTQFAAGTPSSSTFTPIYTRPVAPTQLNNYTLSVNGTQERLFLTFFCNPNNGSVTTTANIIQYEVNFYEEVDFENGGILESAFCYTDGVQTPINCTVSVFGGKTRITLDWSFVLGVNSGETAGQVAVKLDGEMIPREVAGSTNTSRFTEELLGGVGRVIDLDSDLSASHLPIEIVKRSGVIDTNNFNSSKISNFAEHVVGSAQAVTDGTADFSSLQSAVDAAQTGDKILMLQVSITENVTINKKVFIEGKGNSSHLDGDITFGSLSDFSMMKWLRFDNLTFDAGADSIFVRECWQTTGSIVTDNGTGNSKLLIVE